MALNGSWHLSCLLLLVASGFPGTCASLDCSKSTCLADAEGSADSVREATSHSFIQRKWAFPWTGVSSVEAGQKHKSAFVALEDNITESGTMRKMQRGEDASGGIYSLAEPNAECAGDSKGITDPKECHTAREEIIKENGWLSANKLTQGSWYSVPTGCFIRPIDKRKAVHFNTRLVSDNARMPEFQRVCKKANVAAGTPSIWSVVSGACSVDERGCIMSPNYKAGDASSRYRPNDECRIEVLTTDSPAIEVVHFETEAGHDIFRVNGIQYSGTGEQIARLHKGIVPTGTMTWSSDKGVEKTGWLLCPEDPRESMTRVGAVTLSGDTFTLYVDNIHRRKAIPWPDFALAGNITGEKEGSGYNIFVEGAAPMPGPATMITTTSRTTTKAATTTATSTTTTTIITTITTTRTVTSTTTASAPIPQPPAPGPRPPAPSPQPPAPGPQPPIPVPQRLPVTVITTTTPISIATTTTSKKKRRRRRRRFVARRRRSTTTIATTTTGAAPGRTTPAPIITTTTSKKKRRRRSSRRRFVAQRRRRTTTIATTTTGAAPGPTTQAPIITTTTSKKKRRRRSSRRRFVAQRRRRTTTIATTTTGAAPGATTPAPIITTTTSKKKRRRRRSSRRRFVALRRRSTTPIAITTSGAASATTTQAPSFTTTTKKKRRWSSRRRFVARRRRSTTTRATTTTGASPSPTTPAPLIITTTTRKKRRLSSRRRFVARRRRSAAALIGNSTNSTVPLQGRVGTALLYGNSSNSSNSSSDDDGGLDDGEGADHDSGEGADEDEDGEGKDENEDETEAGSNSSSAASISAAVSNQTGQITAAVNAPLGSAPNSTEQIPVPAIAAVRINDTVTK